MVARRKNRTLQRAQLDRTLGGLAKKVPEEPKNGWVYNIREALGMTQTQLAEKLGITRQSMAELEKSEADGRITLSTLKKVAEVLHCDVRLLLVPKFPSENPLEDSVRKQALEVATKIVNRTALHSELEKQGTGEDFRNKQIQEIADELVRRSNRKLWE